MNTLKTEYNKPKYILLSIILSGILIFTICGIYFLINLTSEKRQNENIYNNWFYANSVEVNGEDCHIDNYLAPLDETGALVGRLTIGNEYFYIINVKTGDTTHLESIPTKNTIIHKGQIAFLGHKYISYSQTQNKNIDVARVISVPSGTEIKEIKLDLHH